MGGHADPGSPHGLALMSEEEKAARGRVLGMRKLNGEVVAESATTRGVLEKAARVEPAGHCILGGFGGRRGRHACHARQACDSRGLGSLESEDQRDIAHRDGHMKALQRVI